MESEGLIAEHVTSTRWAAWRVSGAFAHAYQEHPSTTPAPVAEERERAEALLATLRSDGWELDQVESGGYEKHVANPLVVMPHEGSSSAPLYGVLRFSFKRSGNLA